MSFSSGVKDELSRHQTLARHCQIAEIAAIISMCGGVSISEKESLPFKNPDRKRICCKKVLYIIEKSI